MLNFEFYIDITEYMNELNISIQGMNRVVNEIFGKITAFKRSLRLWELQMRSNNDTTSQFWEWEYPPMLWNMRNTLSFFNKNSTLVSKIYASLRPQQTYTQWHLALMLQRFQPIRIQRRQMCTVIRIWGIHLGMRDSLTFIVIFLFRDHARRMLRLSKTHMFVK